MSTKIYKPLHIITASPEKMAQSLYNQDFKTSLEPSGFPLATYRDFVGRSSQLNRVLLHKMRRVAASIMTTEEKIKFDNKNRVKKYLPPLEFCGVNMGFLSKGLNDNSKISPTVDMVKDVHDKIHLKNLAACAMIWRCPVCSLKIMKGREKTIYAVMSEHKRKERFAGFVTLTVPHKRQDSLVQTLEDLNAYYKKIQSHRFFKSFRSYGMLGQIKTVEITWKYQNGWHPHLHILFFYNEKINEDQAKKFQKLLLEKWCAFVPGADLRGQDAQLCYNNNLAGYLGKWDAVKELTGESLKTGKGITPFGMLKKIAVGDYSTTKQRSKLMDLYKEYCEATKGKHRISFGKTLKECYREQIDDSTDEELVHKIDLKEILVQIHLEVWKQITQKHLQPHLINAYLMRGIPGLTALLKYKGINFRIQDYSFNDETGEILNEVPQLI